MVLEAIDSKGIVYAVFSVPVFLDPPLYYIARWQDGSWEKLGPDFYTIGDYGMWINALVVDASDRVIIGGSFVTVEGSKERSYLAMWDNETWIPFGIE